MRSGVLWSVLPGVPDEYAAYRAELDAVDVQRLVLWWEHRIHTEKSSCRLADALASAASHERVRTFIEGNSKMNIPSADLRTSQGLEPVIVTDALAGDCLYIIDGNHRMIAQQITQKGFQNVSVYVCVRPHMLSWVYIPEDFRVTSK
jgi:hypothetical protein